MSTIESWLSPATVAEPLPKRRTATPKAKSKTKPKAGRARGFRVRLPLVWMVVFALLLVGVVTLNIAVLQANVSTNGLDTKIAHVREENAALAAQLSHVRAAPRLERKALKGGLVADPNPTYIVLGSHR